MKSVKQVQKYITKTIFQCYELVLQKAQKLDWTEDSAKALVVIGDCEPHPPSYTDQKINWHDELNALKAMEVKVKYDLLDRSLIGIYLLFFLVILCLLY